ncbi:SDR family oxidoreductase [soil metagenome]
MRIVVTGATKGIGRAITEVFATKGFDVAICARDESALKKLEALLKNKYPTIEVIAVTADMSLRDDVFRFAEIIKGHWETVEVLVNNAGLFLPGNVTTEPEGTLEKLIETNVYSAYYMSRAMLPLLQANDRGHIFNISSVAGLKAYPNGGSYSISKFAMTGLSKALREELNQQNIRVTTVMPGAVLTASWEGVDLPKERFIDVEDLAQLIYDCYKVSYRTVVEDLIVRPMLGDL